MEKIKVAEPADFNELLKSSNYEAITTAYSQKEILNAGEKLIVSIAMLITGEHEASLSIFSDAVRFHSEFSKIEKSNLGLYYFLAGNILEAKKELLNSLGHKEQDYVSYCRLGTIEILEQNEEAAKNNFENAIALNPYSAASHNNLAGVYMRMQAYDLALDHYRVARQLDPNLSQSNEGFAKCLTILGRGEEYLDELYDAVEADPNSVKNIMRLIGALDGLGKNLTALTEINRFLLPIKIWDFDCEEQHDLPNDIEGICVNSQLGQIKLRHVNIRLLYNLQRWQGVIKNCEILTKLNFTEKPEILGYRIESLIEMGLTDKALKVLDSSEEKLASSQISLLECRIAEEEGDYTKAKGLLIDLLTRLPTIDVELRLAQNLTWLGELDAAQEIYLKHAEQRPLLLVSYINSGGKSIDEESKSKLLKIVSNQMTPKNQRISTAHALAEIFEKEQQYDQSWEMLLLANKLSDSDTNWSTKNREKLIDDLIESFPPDIDKNQRQYNSSSLPTPIFIVGMPRSGTTLLEKIISMSGDVFGAGELPTIPKISRLIKKVAESDADYPLNIENLTSEIISEAEAYYDKATKLLRGEASFTVDKMPHNFLHVGLIFRLFPKAKVINLIRDPRDIAISNFQQNFKAKYGGLGYSCCLDKIAHELNCYEKITDHWRTIFGERILEIRYEDLVKDTEKTAKQVINYIGVEWDDSILEFYKNESAVRTASVTQVRQPIYQSSRQKWKRYADKIGNMIESLDRRLIERYQDIDNANPE